MASAPVRSVCALLLLLLVAAARVAEARSILVFAPHPDDETLLAAGVMRAGHAAGDTVTVVVVTNGDLKGVAIGYQRMRESVAAEALLGTPEGQLIFLGYGDESLDTIYRAATDTQIITSAAGMQSTYADRGLGSADYHRYLTGVAGTYNRQTLTSDVEAVLRNIKPDDIYLPGLWDNHPDHRTTYLLVIEALVRIRRSGLEYAPIVHEGLIHAPCEWCDQSYRWPNPPFTPTIPFPKPPFLDSTPLRWNEIESLILPPEMLNPVQSLNLKAQAISDYQSQPLDWMYAFVKENEFFWPRNMNNLALTATATASSANTSQGQSAAKAIDGIVDGYPGDYTREWATTTQTQNAWIRLSWTTSQLVTQVRLYDRPSPNENILGGTLIFSDGSTVPVGTLANNGAQYVTTFAPRRTSSITFRVDAATGTNIGLAEFEVYGADALPVTDQPPVITLGPTAQPGVILDTDISTVSVSATDADGDSLSYLWSTTAGVIVGSGPSVQFYPPFVSQQTRVTISVTVADGRTGATTQGTFVDVTPSFATSLGRFASVAVSSENPGTGQLGVKAIDGVVDGYPGDYTKEWATMGQLSGAWITLTWPVAQHVSQCRLFDRPNVQDNVLGGMLEFSDGSAVPVGTLPNDGSALVVPFATKTITWVRFRVTSAVGSNIGLSEFQVFGAFHNHPPVIPLGPTASPASIADIGVSQIQASASDPDGDAIVYSWSASAGRIVGTGPAVLYYPPMVSTSTRVTITVTVTDTFGATSAPQSAYIDVAPSAASNLARLGSVTMSSQNVSTGQLGAKAVDGIVDGYPGDYTREWATVNELAGAWIRIDWTDSRTIQEVRLFDRPNDNDNITAATLFFSDGTSVSVGRLPNDGSELRVAFAERQATWVMLRVDAATGRNIGLAEFEVFGR